MLIILAGVLINISLGNNGLFNKAKTAKEMYTNTQTQEETEIAKMTNNIDGYVGYSRTGGSNINYSLQEQDTGLKWINGKPIYQRTIALNEELKIYLNGTWQTICQAPNDISNIISYELVGYGNLTVHCLVVNNTEIKAYAGTPGNGNYIHIKYITLQYTKTTD